MKDKGGNLFTLAKALNFVVSCAPLKLATPWQGSCFGHDFSKACQYAYNDATICLVFWKVRRACLDASLHHQKLKTPMKTRFANKVILFQETLEYRDAINLCYGKHDILEL
jgi:hypothetical protein